MDPESGNIDGIHQGKLLIVDDDEFVVEILTTYFRSETAWTIHRCEYGREVMDAAYTLHPHLILLDLKLPDMDGLDLIHKMKNNNGLSHIPIIVVSGHDDLLYKRRALKAGAVRYLTKPVHPTMLKEILSEYIPGPPQA